MTAFKAPDPHLSACLADVDARLSELDEALASADAERIEQQAQALQLSLAGSLAQVRRALQTPGPGGEPIPEALRQRLALARARCMQQQQAVHRATSSFGRTLGVLFPDAPGVGASVPAQTVAARALQAYR